jgi:hypothetical protein
MVDAPITGTRQGVCSHLSVASHVDKRIDRLLVQVLFLIIF